MAWHQRNSVHLPGRATLKLWDVQRAVHQLWVRTGYGSKFKTLSFENACAQLIVSSTYLGGWCKKWQNDGCHFTGKIMICQRILYGTPGKLEKYCELFKQWQITVWRVKPFWGLLFLFQQHYSNPQRDTHVAHLEMMETTSSNEKYPGDTFGIFWRTPRMGVSKNGETPKWMVYNVKSHQNGWFWGTPISGSHHISMKVGFVGLTTAGWSWIDYCNTARSTPIMVGFPVWDGRPHHIYSPLHIWATHECFTKVDTSN